MDTFSHGPFTGVPCQSTWPADACRKAGEDPEQRGFARARRPEQRQNLARINGEIQRRDHLDSVVAGLVVELFDLACFNQRLRHAAHYRSQGGRTKFMESSWQCAEYGSKCDMLKGSPNPYFRRFHDPDKKSSSLPRRTD